MKSEGKYKKTSKSSVKNNIKCAENFVVECARNFLRPTSNIWAHEVDVVEILRELLARLYEDGDGGGWRKVQVYESIVESACMQKSTLFCF